MMLSLCAFPIGHRDRAQHRKLDYGIQEGCPVAKSVLTLGYMCEAIQRRRSGRSDSVKR